MNNINIEKNEEKSLLRKCLRYIVGFLGVIVTVWFAPSVTNFVGGYLSTYQGTSNQIDFITEREGALQKELDEKKIDYYQFCVKLTEATSKDRLINLIPSGNDKVSIIIEKFNDCSDKLEKSKANAAKMSTCYAQYVTLKDFESASKLVASTANNAGFEENLDKNYSLYILEKNNFVKEKGILQSDIDEINDILEHNKNFNKKKEDVSRLLNAIKKREIKFKPGDLSWEQQKILSKAESFVREGKEDSSSGEIVINNFHQIQKAPISQQHDIINNMLTIRKSSYLTKTANTYGEKIFHFNGGEKVILIDRNLDWYKVKYGPNEGYINRDSIKDN